MQRGHLYEANFEGRTYFYVRYNVTTIVDGQPRRVQVSQRLVEKDSAVPSEDGGGTYHMRGRTPSRSLKLKVDSFMLDINQKQQSMSRAHLSSDMRIADFWEQRFLPYCEELLQVTGKPRRKHSTVYGYKQIWRRHLKSHFGELSLRQYEPRLGTRFLASLSGMQGRNTLRHIRALASSIFSRAVIEERVKTNPWRDVKLPADAISPKDTSHYTLEEAENLISALCDHVDCQLVISLSCFLGLRPGEIAALRWEDFDADSVHIRRSVVRGIVDTPKTKESIATLPVVDPHVLIPLSLWHERCGKPSAGWVFSSEKKTPVDLHNLIARVIGPHVGGKKECIRCKQIPAEAIVAWKGLYSGRRGSCTMIIERTGRAEVAQALLRHKSMSTTLNVYKKAITPEAFRNGMKALTTSYLAKTELT